MYRLIFFSLLVSRLALAQNSLHVYYYNGETIEQANVRGVTVSLTLKDTGKLNQVAAYVDNSSSDAVNVLSSNFVLHQISPKDEDLAVKSEQEVQRIAGRRALWGQVVTGVGTGVSRAKDKMTGKESVPTANAPPDYEAQARWLAHVDELGQKGQTVTLAHAYLRGSTVFPGSKFAGVLWFDRDEAFASGVVRVTIGSRGYEFPFPPPDWATTPSKPGQPENDAEKLSTSNPSAYLSDHQPSGSSSFKPGVLGVSGETWSQGGIGGVKILEVAQGSAAEISGLRGGYVITEVNGRKIRSTDDLASMLAQKGPGTKVNISYLFWSNLGWMPKETVVILGSGD
jgi:hypothetical protein